VEISGRDVRSPASTQINEINQTWAPTTRLNEGHRCMLRCCALVGEKNMTARGVMVIVAAVAWAECPPTSGFAAQVSDMQIVSVRVTPLATPPRVRSART
jgi:hypothetical protein